MNGEQLKRANQRLAARMLLVTLGMFGFGFVLVPLYDVFCDITGLNGKTAEQPVERPSLHKDVQRLITVELLSNPGTAGDWDFRPAVSKLQVHPGQLYATRFLARNPNDHPMVVRAVPSVAPGSAARYFHKTECFCFTRQRFAPGETRELPLRFVVDPQLPAGIGTLSLAYTLFVLEPPEITPGFLAESGKPRLETAP